MDDFVAYTSRGKVALLVLLCAVFIAGGLWMVGAFGPTPGSERYSPLFTAIIGWTCVVFCSLAGVMWLQRLFDPHPLLRIGPAGIRARTWSDDTIPWSEITGVGTWSVNRQKGIALRLRDPSRFPGRGLVGRLAGLNRMIAGGDVHIALTGTDRTHKEALAAIARYYSGDGTEGLFSD